MTIETFIADFKAENEVYVSQGLVDDLMLYKWIIGAIQPFGNNICEIDSVVRQVRDYKATLPDNFYALRVAYWCEPRGYHADPKTISYLQGSRTWTERHEYSREWDSCEPQCYDVKEKIITESIYIDEDQNNRVDYYYKNPIPLKLGKVHDRTICNSGCRNLKVRQSPYEIVIRGKTIHTNFKTGNIYMQYYGLPVDSDGVPMIPDSPLGEVAKYVETYVYLKLYEKVLRGKEDTNVITLFNYYVGKERDQRFRALTDSKASKISPDTFKKIKQRNMLRVLSHEINFPII